MKLLRDQISALATASATLASVARYVRRTALRRIPRRDRPLVDAFVEACARWSRQKHAFTHGRDLAQHLHLLVSVSPACDEHPLIERWLRTRPRDADPCIDAMIAELPDHVWTEVEDDACPSSCMRLIDACGGPLDGPERERLVALLTTPPPPAAGARPATAADRARLCAQRGAAWDRREVVEPCKLGVPRWIFSW